MAEFFKDLLRTTIGDQLEVPAILPNTEGTFPFRNRNLRRETCPYFLISRAGIIRCQRKNIPPLVHNGEFVDQTLELRNQVGRHKHRSVPRVGLLVCTNDSLYEL